jgi:hypothetical protein
LFEFLSISLRRLYYLTSHRSDAQRPNPRDASSLVSIVIHGIGPHTYHGAVISPEKGVIGWQSAMFEKFFT